MGKSYSMSPVEDYFENRGLKVKQIDFDHSGNLQIYFAEMKNGDWYSLYYDNGDFTYIVKGPFKELPCRVDDSDISVYDEGSVVFKSSNKRA